MSLEYLVKGTTLRCIFNALVALKIGIEEDTIYYRIGDRGALYMKEEFSVLFDLLCNTFPEIDYYNGLDISPLEKIKESSEAGEEQKKEVIASLVEKFIITEKIIQMLSGEKTFLNFTS